MHSVENPTSNPETPNKRSTSLARKLKETFLGKPARFLANVHVTPNMVTLAGLGMRATSAGLRTYEDSKPESEQREWVYWSATGLSLGSLLMDGLDGSVARAHKAADPNYVNPNGQLVDGLADRAGGMIEILKESLVCLRNGEVELATALACINVLLPLPSFLRAKIEENGGTTKEQSFNPLTFGGTHAGRTLVIELLSLKKVQLNRILGLIGISLTEPQFNAWRKGLIAYLAISNGIVVAQRAWALRRSVLDRRQREAQQPLETAITPSEEYPEEGEIIDEIPLDSAGLSKTQEDHRVRGFWYGMSVLLATGTSSVLLWWIHHNAKE